MGYYFITAMHGIPAQTSYEKAVCLSVGLSVCLSVKCVDSDKMGKFLSRFVYHTKNHLA